MRLDAGTRLLILLAVSVFALIVLGIFLPEHLPSLLGGLRADVRNALVRPYFHIPNSEFINNRVTNWTVNDRQVRFDVPPGVSYGSDPEHVRELLLEVAGRHPDVLEDPGPEILFKGLGDSSLDFHLRVWTTTRVQTPLPLASELYFSIFRAFKENGIEIPFPQRDLQLKTVSPSIRAVPVPGDPRKDG